MGLPAQKQICSGRAWHSRDGWALAALLWVAQLSLTPLHAAQNASNHCSKAWFWKQDFTRVQGNEDWSSWGADASFRKGPCLMIPGIQMTVTWRSTVIITDGTLAKKGAAVVNNMTVLGIEVVLDKPGWPQRALDLLTVPACSSGVHLPNGTLLTIGGYFPPDQTPILPGTGSIRAIDPCTDGKCTFSIVGNMNYGRWYPTAVILPDGRAIIVGGSNAAVTLTDASTNIPSLEYFPAGGTKPVYLRLLDDALPYNLYPFVHVLPSGYVFIFSGSKWVLFNTRSNKVVEGKRPELMKTGPNGKQIFRSYPLTGTSALLPLQPNATAEVLICGGSTTEAYGKTGSGGYSTSGGNANSTADNMCYIIRPEDSNPKWTGYQMRFPRIMPNAVLLPDGHVLIVNGAMTGWAGIGRNSHKAVLTPEMFHASKKQFYKGPLPASKIPRVYHSSAVLLGNGTVFISGSNPNYKRIVDGEDFPTEYRAEFFFPPYAKDSKARPIVVSAPTSIRIGNQFNVNFSSTAGSPKTVQVVLCHPGFSTHSTNHGMRNVVLPVTSTKSEGKVMSVRVTGCPNKNVCPPTWYWVFVVVNGIPSLTTWVTFVQ